MVCSLFTTSLKVAVGASRELQGTLALQHTGATPFYDPLLAGQPKNPICQPPILGHVTKACVPLIFIKTHSI